MLLTRTLGRHLSALASQRIVRNLAWLAGGDLLTRAVRIGSIAIVARLIDPDAFGLAALLLSSHELVKVGAQIGTGQSIIRAKADDLEAVAETCWRLNWMICTALALVQIAVAVAIGAVASDWSITLLGTALAAVFIGMPVGLVHVYLGLRAERADAVAKIAAAQNMADAVLTVALALAGAGVWALVLPKALTLPIWLVGVRRIVSWRPEASVTPAPWRPILHFGLPILGSEALVAARNHLDKPLIGLFLGIDALGVWYLATSAGTGLAQAVSSAFSFVLMPFLCKDEGGENRTARFDRFVRIALPVLTLVFIAQAFAAPVYVPLIFGHRWSEAAAIVAVLCLSGGPRLLWDGVVQLARSEGRSGIEFSSNLLTGFLSFAGLTIGAQHDLLNAALAMVMVTAAAQIGLSLCIRFITLRNPTPS
ncbi:oligosaccharide flippase family protein [Parvularcula maris]|uniref:Oligosaccharide flippase family protein n=1 Tax=Parvularcula maris TaxID=2965077 RepID=A0A9X2L6H7_9PROT|nr:oligosaccharide flippase family protein [Parvularcula maris]MCQ8183950.1 oligosaccharide flippase family protein [Parvularcula maris]